MCAILKRFSVNENAIEQELSLPIKWCLGGGGRIPDLREHAELQSDGVGLAFTYAFADGFTFANLSAGTGEGRSPADANAGASELFLSRPRTRSDDMGQQIF